MLTREDMDMIGEAVERARWAMVRSFLEERYGEDMVTDMMVSATIQALDEMEEE